MLAAYAVHVEQLPRTPLPRASASLPQRLSARPRPRHSRSRLPPPRSQDAGLHPPLLRPLPQPPHPHPRSLADFPHHRRSARPQRRSRRSAGAGPRHRPPSLRPRRRKSARRRHARARTLLRSQPARPAHRRRLRAALRRLPRPESDLRSARRHHQALARLRRESNIPNWPSICSISARRSKPN